MVQNSLNNKELIKSDSKKLDTDNFAVNEIIQKTNEHTKQMKTLKTKTDEEKGKKTVDLMTALNEGGEITMEEKIDLLEKAGIGVLDESILSEVDRSTINKIIKLKEIGININKYDLDRYLSNEILSKIDESMIKNILKLREVSLDVESYYDLQKMLEFDDQITIDNALKDNKIKLLQDAGIWCNLYDIPSLAKIRNIDTDIVNMYKSKTNNYRDILKHLIICERIGKDEFTKIMEKDDRLSLLDEVAIRIEEKDKMIEQKRLESERAEKLKFLEDVGMGIPNDYKYFRDEDLPYINQGLIENISELKKIGIDVSVRWLLYNYIVSEIDELLIKDIITLKSAGIKLNDIDMINFLKLDKSIRTVVIEKVILLQKAGIKVDMYYTERMMKLSTISIERINIMLGNAKILKDAGLQIEMYNIIKLLDIDPSVVKQVLVLIGAGMKMGLDDIASYAKIPEYIRDDIVKNSGRNKNLLKEIRQYPDNDYFHRVRKQDKIQEYRDIINHDKNLVSYIIPMIIDKINSMGSFTEQTFQQIIKKMYPYIGDIDGAVQLQIINKVQEYISKIINIEKYMNMPEYKHEPAKLLCKIRNMSDDVLLDPGDIKMKRKGASIVFSVPKEIDYMKIYANKDVSIQNNQYVDKFGKKLNVSGGFSTKQSNINDLSGTLNVINRQNINSRREEEVITHENQHTENKYTFINSSGSTVEFAKDEIIAYMKDGSSKEMILFNLTNPNGLYTYGLKTRKGRDYHVKKVTEAVNIAFKLKDAGIESYLHLLSITPISQFYKLEEQYNLK